MLANGRWDLIRRLKIKVCIIFFSVFFVLINTPIAFTTIIKTQIFGIDSKEVHRTQLNRTELIRDTTSCSSS